MSIDNKKCQINNNYNLFIYDVYESYYLQGEISVKDSSIDYPSSHLDLSELVTVKNNQDEVYDTESAYFVKNQYSVYGNDDEYERYFSDWHGNTILTPGSYYLSEVNGCYPIKSWYRKQFTVHGTQNGNIKGYIWFDNDLDENDNRKNSLNYGFTSYSFKDHVKGKQFVLQPGNIQTVADENGAIDIHNIPFGTYNLEIVDSVYQLTAPITVTIDANNSFLDELAVGIRLKDDFSFVSGSLKIDYDKDCRSDYNEQIANHEIIIDYGDQVIYTDKNGAFSVVLPNGYHNFSFGDLDTSSQFCSGNWALPFDTLLDETNTYIDMHLLFMEGEYHETSVNVNSPLLRPGFESTYRIQINNTGSFTESGVLKIIPNQFDLDSLFRVTHRWGNNYDSTYIESDSVSGDTLFYKISNFDRNTRRNYAFKQTLPPDETLLDQEATVYAWLATGNPEAIPENNAAISNVRIRGSYDPNDMTLMNVGRSNNSNILITDEWLHYRIRFQNTGTYYAEKVVVIDTLPAEVDPSTIVLMGASHDYVYEIFDGNILRWTFNGIKLPAEQNDEPNSHGWIKFKIKQGAGNQLGDIVSNKAEIYFDFNSPIITNSTMNEIGEIVIIPRTDLVNALDTKEVLDISIFPNPATNKITFSQSADKIEVMNLLGVVILETEDSESLDIAAIDSGTYLVRLTKGDLSKVEKLIKK